MDRVLPCGFQKNDTTGQNPYFLAKVIHFGKTDNPRQKSSVDLFQTKNSALVMDALS